MHIRQIAVVARELEAVVAEITFVLGVDVSFRDPGVEQFGLHNAVMPIGTTFLEVVSPVRDGTTAGRFLARRGDSGYMVLLQTADLRADRARLDRMGARVVWETQLDDIASIHIHPRDIGGAIVALEQPQPRDSWRWGGPEWPAHVRTDIVSRIVGAELEARDARAMAARWGAALDLPVTHRSDGLSSIPLEVGELRFVPLGAHEEGLSAVLVEARDPGRALDRARARGLRVDERSFHVSGTRFELLSTGKASP